MKTSSRALSARATLSVLLLLMGVALLGAIPFAGRLFALPPVGNVGSGNVGPSPGGATASWNGVASAPGGGANTEAACVEGANCETFNLTVDGTKAAWAGQKVQVQLTWQSNLNEYDIYIHKGSLAGPVITSVMAGPGLTSQTAYIDVATNDTGPYTIHMVYDTTPAAATDHYHGTATAVPETPAPPPPAPQDPGAKVGYENFEAPGVLTPGTSTSSGALTVEYMGRGAGEPSVGSNWATGVANFQSDLETLFITFDDSCSLLNPKASWVNRRAPTSVFIDSDPIGFTDRGTTAGRVFASELTLLSPDTVKISHSDDDGQTWIVAQSGGLASAVDHQTIGGGIYHAPVPSGVNPLYPKALYYCSQDIAAALCSRSDDGGTTYGPSVPIYNLTACGGLHGHVKVSPKDGTVYVPNRGCPTNSAVVVSQDNGVTWTVRTVQNGSVANTAASDDPAVGIDDNGRVYFLFANNGAAAAVATSDDFGVSWQNIVDVGAIYGLKNIAFPAAVGGSSTGGNTGRAAVAFYGTVTGTGDSNVDTFTGVWHLYVAHTFDGGLTWTTTDATPNMPMQRTGILRGGGGPVTRNLLDFFDITIDRDGRVLVGYVNGCAGGNCVQAPINPDGSSAVTGNAYSVTATIARQSSGRRLLASKVTPTTSVPGMPFVTQRRVGPVVHLQWSEADTGNSPITGYDILRGTTSGGEAFLAHVTGTQIGGTFDDTTATDVSKTYYYNVLAINGTASPLGSSCANNEIAAPYVGDNCTGIIIHRNLPTHPEALGGSAMQPPVPQLLIDYIAVAEPPAKSGQFLFKMKVGNLSTVPPNSRWRMVWDSPASVDEQYYVGMTSDGSNPPVVSFEYGRLQTASLVVLGVPTEIFVAAADPASNYNVDGTISIFVAKSALGNPQPGDLLGAVNGRTFDTGDSHPNTLERSNLLVDHTFVKGNTDNSFPAATYTVSGNNSCTAAGLVPVGAVSRKSHGNGRDFDIDLPLTGSTGIECRTGPAAGQHTVLLTFPVPVNVNSANATCGGQPATATANGSVVTITCTGLANAQTVTVALNGVSDGTNTGNVSVPLGLLLGDVNASRRVDGTDLTSVRQESLKQVTDSNFRNDVNISGRIDGRDGTVVAPEAQALRTLP